MRAAWRDHVLPVVFALAVAILMTWPLAARLSHAGRLDTDDGRFSVWNVAWVARTLVVDPLGVYDANIFYPHRGTLAYSEANLGAGVLAIPAYWISGGNPYTAHNVVLILGFVLSVLGPYYLVRHLTGHRVAGLVSGVAFAFCPFVFSHIPHIQLLLSAGLPFSLLAMHRFVERQTAGRALALGLVLAAQALSCGYYGIFAALLITPGIMFYAASRRRWTRWTYWAGAAGAAAVSIGVVLPFFLPYLELQQSTGFVRTMDEARRWSAVWSSYLASAAWAHRWAVPWLPPWGEVLYPGTAAILLGGLGAVVAWRAPAIAGGRDHVIFYAATGALACWASFGPDAGLYYLLHQYVPVFGWIRAPSRLGLVVVLALAVLAGFAAAWILGRARRAALTAALLVTVTTADLFVAPLFLVEADPIAPAYQSLKKWPYGTVAEFPFFYLRMDFPRHAYYMLNSTYHWRPLVNGYSDYIPPDFRQMVIPLSSFPNPESFAILKQFRVRYVIFHLNLYSRAARRDLEARLEAFRAYLRPIRKEDPAWLFEITAWPPPA